MVNYPEDFLNRMKYLLGEEYKKFYSSLDKPHFRGLRVNTLKCSSEKLKKLLPFGIAPSPFSKDSFYFSNEVQGIGNSPLHHAGAFYIQEPSASSAVEILSPKPYDKVLDLCAAPGGKSTQIAAKLNGTGLLWSNEIVKSRAQILLSNMERMGVKNAVISSVSPEILCKNLPEFFDKVLVDAPCSGEGMFRKDADAIKEWSLEHTKSCKERQLNILESAKYSLKENGILVYSTCTFSSYENEEVIEEFLKKNPNFSLEDCNVSFGREALKYARRIYPMDGGEGHFVAKLRKKRGDNLYTPVKTHIEPKDKVEKEIIKQAKDLYSQIFLNNFENLNFAVNKDKVIIMPDEIPDIPLINVLRAGVLLGEVKKNRIEPCHHAFMCARAEEVKSLLNLDINSSEIEKFLKGEEINVPNDFKGYCGVAVNNIITGFGKCSNGRLKNKYPKGLRKF